MKYKIINSDISIHNKHYSIGSNVLLDDKDVIGIENYLEPIEEESKETNSAHIQLDKISNNAKEVQPKASPKDKSRKPAHRSSSSVGGNVKNKAIKYKRILK